VLVHARDMRTGTGPNQRTEDDCGIKASREPQRDLCINRRPGVYTSLHCRAEFIAQIFVTSVLATGNDLLRVPCAVLIDSTWRQAERVAGEEFGNTFQSRPASLDVA